jgi:hypothetical protein
VLERDGRRVLEAYAPDFYLPELDDLPELDVYLECTVMKQSNVSRKSRKVRKLRRRYGVVVGILYRLDIMRLAREYGLEGWSARHGRPARTDQSSRV